MISSFGGRLQDLRRSLWTGAGRYSVAIAEHQDVWSSERATVRAAWQFPARPERLQIDVERRDRIALHRFLQGVTQFRANFSSRPTSGPEF